MKRLLSIAFSFSLLFGLSTNALASENEKSNLVEAHELAYKTNQKINEKIQAAQEEADELRADYLSDIRKLNGGNGVTELSKQNTAINEEDLALIQEKLTAIENTLIAEQGDTTIPDHMRTVASEINNITTILEPSNGLMASSTESESQKKDKYNELTMKYAEKLDHIISDLYNETLKMSQHTINKINKLGIKAECTWIEVCIGGKWVNIDPIAIVGDN